MTTLADAHTREEISLLASLNGEWFKLPLKIMQDAGSAAQTLGGILKITNRETFVSAGKLSERARLPVATVRKQLGTLQHHGWIENAGREHTRAGRARRTCTMKLTTKTKASLADYAILPWWACCHIGGTGRLPWSSKAVLSVIMARLAAFKAAIERQDGQAPNDDDFWGSLDNMGGEDRFQFSLDRLERETGLSRPAVVDAKRQLANLGIVEWIRNTRDGGDDTDVLFPNQAFRVVATPKSEGTCTLTFKVARG